MKYFEWLLHYFLIFYTEFYISLIFFTQMSHHLHFKDTALYGMVYDVKVRNN